MDLTKLNFDANEMLDGLQKWVLCESPSFDRTAVNRMQDIAAHDLALMGASVERITPHPLAGDCIRARIPHPDIGDPGILILGHMDTVHPIGTLAKLPVRRDGNLCYGPGIADMKGGNYLALEAIRQLATVGAQTPLPITVLFTSDEEIGSPTSQDVIIAEAKKARLAFNSEPGRPNGNIVTRRKGGIFCHCDIFGVAAHSGGFFEEGRSAIEELARKIQALHALTDLDRGITLNVGLVAGGQSVNTVAAEASCDIDIRYRESADRDKVFERVHEICRTTSVDGTSSNMSVRGEFHPLNPSQQSTELFDIYTKIAANQNVIVKGEHSGGCADSGFIAGVGTPVICGVGPIGGNYHRADEWMEIDSLAERAKFIAETILALASQPTKTNL